LRFTPSIALSSDNKKQSSNNHLPIIHLSPLVMAVRLRSSNNSSFIARDDADWEVALRECVGRLANRATVTSSAAALTQEIAVLDVAALPAFVAALVDERDNAAFQNLALVNLIAALALRRGAALAVPQLAKLLHFLLRRVAEHDSLLEAALPAAFAALAQHCVADVDALFRIASPLFASLTRKLDRQQRFAALALAAALRAAPTNVVRAAAPELADRTLDLGSSACTDLALPELLAVLVVLADVAGADELVLERAPACLRFAVRSLDSAESRARTAAADALVAFAKAFHGVALALAPEVIAALDQRRYDTAKLARAAIVAAINHYEFVAAGGAVDAAVALPLPTALPTTTPATARTRSALSTGARLLHTPTASPAAAAGAASEHRRSIFASKPNAAFFADSSAGGGADSLPGLSLADLASEPPSAAQKRFQDALHSQSAATPTRSLPILGAGTSARTLNEMSGAIRQLQEQQASIVAALDQFSSKVSLVLASVNDRLVAIERHIGLAAHEAPPAAPTAAAAAPPVDEEKQMLQDVEAALDSVSGLTPAQREAGLRTVASLFDCESDAALLSLLAVIDAKDALTALSRVQPVGVRLARFLVRRAVTAAASAGTTSGELTSTGVRWAAMALEVDYHGDAGAAADVKQLGLWTDAMTGPDYAAVRKAVQRCAGRPGASGFDAARVFAAMPMPID
jgi:hypothetical protein